MMVDFCRSKLRMLIRLKLVLMVVVCMVVVLRGDLVLREFMKMFVVGGICMIFIFSLWCRIRVVFVIFGVIVVRFRRF